MDYIEIMNFCGYDMDKAHEMAMQYRGKSFSEIIKAERNSKQGANNQVLREYLFSNSSCEMSCGDKDSSSTYFHK